MTTQTANHISDQPTKSSIVSLHHLPALTTRGITVGLWWFWAILTASLGKVLAGFFGKVAISQILHYVAGGLFWLGVTVFVITWFLALGIAKWGKLKTLTLRQDIWHNLPVFSPTTVHATLTSPKPLPSWLSLTVTNNYSADVVFLDLPYQVPSELLQQLSETDDETVSIDITYTLIAQMRGDYDFSCLFLRASGFLGLWYRTFFIQDHTAKPVRVLANFRQLEVSPLHAIANKTAPNGQILERLRGAGQDFHQIRSYSEGDSLRQVDWRATSRQRRLMSKEYQNEKEQTVFFLLDSSQNLRHQRLLEINGTQTLVGHLDTVLNAMLRLAIIATQQGDATGFVSFSGQNDVIAPPKKGATVLNYLLNQSATIATSLKMPDYIGVAKMALSLLKKRSLVVLITSTRTENLDELLTAVELLRGKHLVVVANLYEQDLVAQLSHAPALPTTAQTQQVIYHHLDTQRRLMSRLSTLTQVTVIHCSPDKLAHRLTEGYLKIKRRGGW